MKETLPKEVMDLLRTLSTCGTWYPSALEIWENDGEMLKEQIDALIEKYGGSHVVD